MLNENRGNSIWSHPYTKSYRWSITTERWREELIHQLFNPKWSALDTYIWAKQSGLGSLYIHIHIYIHLYICVYVHVQVTITKHHEFGSGILKELYGGGSDVQNKIT